MQKIGIRLLVIVGIVIIIIGGNWIFDRSGPVSSWTANQSGSLVERYQTLSENAPRIAESDLITDYMQEGVTEHTAHIIHTQQSLVSDFLWIRNIQQIGKFILRDSVPGLFGMMDNLTTLSPVRAFPYAFIQYVGPQQPPQGEQASDREKETRQQTVDLGEVGIRMTCDQVKVAAIIALSDKEFVDVIESKGEQYDNLREPCQLYELAHTLGFNYFYYFKDLEKAISYYKIAAFHEEAPVVTAMMPALLRSRQGEHLISAQLRFDRAMALDMQTSDAVVDEQYTRAIGKAIGELQIHLLEQADASDDTCTQDYSCLISSGAIRQAIQTLSQQCTDDADLSEQVQCILLQQGLEQSYININGALISPFATSLESTREYSESWGGWKTQ